MHRLGSTSSNDWKSRYFNGLGPRHAMRTSRNWCVLRQEWQLLPQEVAVMSISEVTRMDQLNGRLGVEYTRVSVSTTRIYVMFNGCHFEQILSFCIKICKEVTICYSTSPIFMVTIFLFLVTECMMLSCVLLRGTHIVCIRTEPRANELFWDLYMTPNSKASGQRFWLQIQRSRVRFPALSDFLRSSGSGTGSTQPREDNWEASWKK
jgi:hypothetical protein